MDDLMVHEMLDMTPRLPDLAGEPVPDQAGDEGSWSSAIFDHGFEVIWGSDPDNVWAAGDAHLVYSADHGRSWAVRDTQLLDRVNDIWGVNANKICAAGCCGKAALAVSGDQGRTWQAISVAPGMTTGDFSAIAGFGDGIFLAGSAEQQARTMRLSSDAGGAWQETAVPMRNAITQLRSLEFGRVYGLAGAYVTYTEDRGQSWLEWPRHVGSAQLAFWVLDPGRILSCSTGGAVYTGAGGVFARVTSPAKTDLYAIWGISQDDFWVGGINVIAHTKDGGRSWSAKAIPGSIRSIWGSGPNEVYFAGPSAIYHYHRS